MRIQLRPPSASPRLGPESALSIVIVAVLFLPRRLSLLRPRASRDLAPRGQDDAAALDATLAADRAELESARLNLEYPRNTAPIDGLTGALRAHLGDVVRVNDSRRENVSRRA
jgi:multidrug efflux pump subunit AcrA (membrane-fusion protein)